MKTLNDIKLKIKSVSWPKIETVIGIAKGGIIPATMIAEFLMLPLDFIWVSLRDSQHKPIYDQPQIYNKPKQNLTAKSILLVEDRVKTGTTLNYVKDVLTKKYKKIEIISFAVNGKADISLYDETCFPFPWII